MLQKRGVALKIPLKQFEVQFCLVKWVGEEEEEEEEEKEKQRPRIQGKR